MRTRIKVVPGSGCACCALFLVQSNPSRHWPVMPKVCFEGQEIECEVGERLRHVLHRAGTSPHNGAARRVNCRGFGTCGTCAVRIEGPVSPVTRVERGRLDFPPHRFERGLRLACQAQVLGDVEVTKYRGFWGQEVRNGTRPLKDEVPQ